MTVIGAQKRCPRGTQGPTRMSWWWDLRCRGGFARECPVTTKLSEVREWRLLARKRLMGLPIADVRLENPRAVGKGRLLTPRGRLVPSTADVRAW
jgi:hypothetical protein